MGDGGRRGWTAAPSAQMEVKTFPTLRTERAVTATTKTCGKGVYCFFYFFPSVSYGQQITNYCPLFSPDNQLVPEPESPAQFGLSLKMRSRLSTTKAVQLLISGARLSQQPNTFVEL